MRSEPTSGGRRKNTAAALTETIAIVTKARLKFSSARTSAPGLSKANPCSAPAPAATPTLSDNCWAAEEKLTARLIFEASISAKTIALRLVNSSERTKPLNRSHVIMKMSGVEGVKKP